MSTMPDPQPTQYRTRPALDVDLDDTTGCPVAAACEGCDTADDLAVATVGTTFGVHCLTLCAECCDRPLPGLPLLTALTRVGDHCAHLGIDLDMMAEAIDGEAAR